MGKRLSGKLSRYRDDSLSELNAILDRRRKFRKF